MWRGLFERWRRFCLSIRDRLAGRGEREESADARFERLSRALDSRFARAARQIDKLEAAVQAPSSRRPSGRLQRIWSRAERRVQSMVKDASRSVVRRPPEYNHAEAIAEVERRLEGLKACLTDIEAERDQAAEEAVSCHRRGILFTRTRDISWARDSLQRRREHEAEYVRCAREARKIKAILDEMSAAAQVMASLGGRRSSG